MNDAKKPHQITVKIIIDKLSSGMEKEYILMNERIRFINFTCIESKVLKLDNYVLVAILTDILNLYDFLIQVCLNNIIKNKNMFDVVKNIKKKSFCSHCAN